MRYKEMNEVKVSIVVPCYQQGQYLSEAIDSVIAQTYQNWECLIVNDGSLDNTEEIALYYTEKDERIKYLKKTNGGLSSARNFGIKKSKGEYILPLDADDKIGSRYLEEAVKILDANSQLKIVYCREGLFGKKRGENILPTFNIELMLCENLIFCTAMYRRLDFDKTKGYNENMKFGFEDWDFWLSLLKNGGEVHKINQIMFYYRIKNTSMLNAMTTQKKAMMRRQIWENHQELFAKYYLNPLNCFEYKAVAQSKEYKLGLLLLKPVRKLLSKF